MDFDKPAISEVQNESDVEQKFVYPVLIATFPSGFGLRQGSIITKASLRRFEIDKGNSKKLYYPDYVVTFGSYPLVVIEAKGPGVDLNEAFREARLYATELNSTYPSGVNPVRYVCATNLQQTWLGLVDSAVPTLTLEYEDINPYSEKMAAAQNMIGFDALRGHFLDLSRTLKPRSYYKPRRMVGGFLIQQEEVGQNAFGSTLVAELGHIFNPVTRQDRLRIATEGYVSSPKRDRYVDPIDKVIRAAAPSWQVNSTLIRDPSQPLEILKPFTAHRELEHRIILVIGERGAGKTTFLYHLQAVALPADVREHTVWVHIDINDAPVAKAEIYDWIRREIIRGVQLAFPGVDFEDIDTIQKIYSVETNKFNKGIGSLLPEGSPERAFELYKLLLRCQEDIHQTAVCYTRHFGTERDSLIVIVFDNADKRARDEQLLMFEVAQWLQKEFRALVILPIREETFDNHQREPPLDTALKDLVFRIEPPVFQQALVKRVQMALDEIAAAHDARLTYELPNGFKVQYAETERSYFITSIVASIFEYDSSVRRLIMGLAGNDLRRVFEIFVSFCLSGHIGESEILRMRQSKGEYVLPIETVMTVLLRANRRFYDGDASLLKNILDLDEKDDRPSHFNRISILKYLRERYNDSGRNGLKGYFQVSEVQKYLAVYGSSSSVVRREVNYLAKSECIITESLVDHDVSEDELIKLGPVGFVHLELLGLSEYWAAVAEDTNFGDRAVALRVADRIADIERQYNHGIALQNGRALFDYLETVRQAFAMSSSALLEKSRWLDLTDISAGDDALRRAGTSIKGGQWFEAAERFPAGSEADGSVINAPPGVGLFVELAPGVTGLLHRSRLPGGGVLESGFMVGDTIRVRVRSVEPETRRMSLTMASRSALQSGS